MIRNKQTKTTKVYKEFDSYSECKLIERQLNKELDTRLFAIGIKFPQEIGNTPCN